MIYHKDLLIEHAQEGQYLTLPFDMPPDSEALTLRYDYHRYDEGAPLDDGAFTPRTEVNIIDLGLIDPSGRQVGASGSNKREISVSEVAATPGYRPTRLEPGQWQALLGAYKVEDQGVQVRIEITITEKRLRWLKGDLHAHTLASDGVHTVEELAAKALRHKLDFLAITDHNQMATAEALPRTPGVTLIPGVEWTHYRAHANFLGVDRPYDGPFAANTDEEIRARFHSARERGALIVLNHPFEPCCPFTLDYNSLPFDCLEVWNGPMREPNLRALGLWQSLLAAGRKVPVCGGSDYHRDTPFLFLGGPTTWVYALSNGPSDILAALRAGRAYITFAPDGPTLEMTAGEVTLGESAPWPEMNLVRIAVERLEKGDSVRLVTPRGSQTLFEAPSAGRYEKTHEIEAPGFARLEIWRDFLPGVPKLPALLANPIYFDPA